jgi:hypothetical protein
VSIYREMFMLHKHYHYSNEEVLDLFPFEYEILLALVQEDIRKENELARQREANRR